MAAIQKSRRYIYKTRGVCPPEIQFRIEEGILSDIRFVGGGCTGNAQLISRLVNGLPVDEVVRLASGIDCRNGTSCPDQLSAAVKAADEGRLLPGSSFSLVEDPVPRDRIGLIGELAGDADAIEKVAAAMKQAGVDHIVCMGGITGESTQNKDTLKALHKLDIQAVQGQADWNYACHTEGPLFPPLDQQARNWLIQLPQVRIFYLGSKKCMAFSGDFIQKLPGYSDYEPYALEINMVCGLTDFMRDETVFPALESMTPQFNAEVVLFSQTGQWGHWHVGDKDFIGIGPAAGSVPCWGLLECISGNVNLRRMPVDRYRS